MIAQSTFDFWGRPTSRARRDRGEIIVDSFAGGGGASMGIEWALGRCVDVAINHNEHAIAMHEENHPHTKHVREDIWKVDHEAVTHGRPVGLLWCSPDCKHFSRAKGAKPVEKKIRSLAWVVITWAKRARPRVIILENVREFAEWGPLTKDNKPCKARKGLTFKRWVGRLRALGYVVEWRVLNAADYGAPTHRRRLFLIARRDGRPIVWPEPTHGPGREHPWRTAAECIDWSLACPSIFLTKEEGRKVGCNRPLAEKTMRRIAHGLKRYVLDNPRPFIVGVGGRMGQTQPAPVDQPSNTITAKNDRSLVVPSLLRVNHGGDEFRGQSVCDPLSTVTGHHGQALMAPTISRIGQTNGNGSYSYSAEDPLTTVTSKAEHLLVAPNLVHYHSEKGPGENRASSLDEPLPVQTTENRFGLVSAFVAQHFGGMVGKPADVPLPTVTGIDHNALVASNLIHMNHGEEQWSAVDEPLRTVSAGGNHAAVVAFLLKYFGTAIGQHLSAPLHTVTSKPRFAIVNVAGVSYAIADIGMRMLTPRDLARAQGFPEDYRLIGTKARQVAAIGNSVCPVMARVLVEANYKPDQRPAKRAGKSQEVFANA